MKDVAHVKQITHPLGIKMPRKAPQGDTTGNRRKVWRAGTCIHCKAIVKGDERLSICPVCKRLWPVNGYTERAA